MYVWPIEAAGQHSRVGQGQAAEDVLPNLHKSSRRSSGSSATRMANQNHPTTQPIGLLPTRAACMLDASWHSLQHAGAATLRTWGVAVAVRAMQGTPLRMVLSLDSSR